MQSYRTLALRSLLNRLLWPRLTRVIPPRPLPRQRRGHMFVNDQPLRAALLPDGRVPAINLAGPARFWLSPQMKRHRRPDTVPTLGHLEIVPRSQFAAGLP